MSVNPFTAKAKYYERMVVTYENLLDEAMDHEERYAELEVQEKEYEVQLEEVRLKMFHLRRKSKRYGDRYMQPVAHGNDDDGESDEDTGRPERGNQEQSTLERSRCSQEGSDQQNRQQTQSDSRGDQRHIAGGQNADARSARASYVGENEDGHEALDVSSDDEHDADSLDARTQAQDDEGQRRTRSRSHRHSHTSSLSDEERNFDNRFPFTRQAQCKQRRTANLQSVGEGEFLRRPTVSPLTANGIDENLPQSRPVSHAARSEDGSDEQQYTDNGGPNGYNFSDNFEDIGSGRRRASNLDDADDEVSHSQRAANHDQASEMAQNHSIQQQPTTNDYGEQRVKREPHSPLIQESQRIIAHKDSDYTIYERLPDLPANIIMVRADEDKTEWHEAISCARPGCLTNTFRPAGKKASRADLLNGLKGLHIHAKNSHKAEVRGKDFAGPVDDLKKLQFWEDADFVERRELDHEEVQAIKKGEIPDDVVPRAAATEKKKTPSKRKTSEAVVRG